METLRIFDFRFWILDFRNKRVDASSRQIEKAFGANSVAGVRGDRSPTFPTGNRCIHKHEGLHRHRSPMNAGANSRTFSPNLAEQFDHQRGRDWWLTLGAIILYCHNQLLRELIQQRNVEFRRPSPGGHTDFAAGTRGLRTRGDGG
jgi:hypothetical protein